MISVMFELDDCTRNFIQADDELKIINQLCVLIDTNKISVARYDLYVKMLRENVTYVTRAGRIIWERTLAQI